ncbi:MAG: chemotaxis protein CheY, partial [Flaviaesturariibacter sp.]|nr:chemotaxis protein CheY [Flaviaesturariibacter sp.]
IRCIVIEDEPLAVKVLVDYIHQTPFLELCGTFRDALLATDYLRDHTVDLIFLDIHLPKLKGMAFLKTLVHPPAVIITTAYHQYAVEGFELNVTDYLLKPFEFERFLVAVTKVRSGAGEKPGEPNEPRNHLFVNVAKKKVKVLFDEILYIESQREYIKIATTRATYLTKMGTQEIEDLLPARLFKRIHRSFIVSLAKIDSYTAEEVGVGGVSIPVGRAYRGIIDDL